MNTNNKFEVKELTNLELAEIDGGCATLLIACIGVCIAAYGAGYTTGKAIFN